MQSLPLHLKYDAIQGRQARCAASGGFSPIDEAPARLGERGLVHSFQVARCKGLIHSLTDGCIRSYLAYCNDGLSVAWISFITIIANQSVDLIQVSALLLGPPAFAAAEIDPIPLRAPFLDLNIPL